MTTVIVTTLLVTGLRMVNPRLGVEGIWPWVSQLPRGEASPGSHVWKAAPRSVLSVIFEGPERCRDTGAFQARRGQRIQEPYIYQRCPFG